MRRNGIRFEDLRLLLLELGFREAAMDSNHFRFAHSVTGTVLLFRMYRANEVVSDRDILVVRRQLVDNGFIELAAFDRFLEKATA
jgi:hypothetical protein